MTTHDFDAYCDTLPLEEPPYHEQMLFLQEVEEAHEAALKQQGAIEALQNLMVTLSVLMLLDGTKGDYFFGLHDALDVIKRNLGAVKGGG
jgi:hypothetical protein